MTWTLFLDNTQLGPKSYRTTEDPRSSKIWKETQEETAKGSRERIRISTFRKH